MPRQSDTRQKMILSQALLQRERGVAGTALPDVLEHSGAPRGSIYHHFPDGRAQLAEEATKWAGDYVAVLQETDFAAGCPVVAGALDATTREAAAAGFRRWEQLLRDALEGAGVPAARAESLAVLFIASIEGAIVLSRAEGTTRPIEQASRQLRSVLELELA